MCLNRHEQLMPVDYTMAKAVPEGQAIPQFTSKAAIHNDEHRSGVFISNNWRDLWASETNLQHLTGKWAIAF